MVPSGKNMLIKGAVGQKQAFLKDNFLNAVRLTLAYVTPPLLIYGGGLVLNYILIY
jgi:hypothetical protein